jgi:protein-L-isoaspartate(D-aspartate) O-methyltransferase
MDNGSPTGFDRAREAMVRKQIERRGITDERLLAALGRVPRHEYVLPDDSDDAYSDGPLSIGHRQTISQPYIVAYMTDALGPIDGTRILEIGTGSGYQTAVLAELAREVFTIEVVDVLARSARERLDRAGYRNISFRIGDGAGGWIKEAPFDAIIVTAAPARDPVHLKDQLVDGGKIIVPVGTGHQVLKRFTRRGGELDCERLIGVRFVPLV